MKEAASIILMTLWIPFMIIGFTAAFVFYGLQSGWIFFTNIVDVL